jgi:hypothetical protein
MSAGAWLIRFWPILTLTLAALSVGPSFAHALEAMPRLRIWPPKLWIDATVLHGQFVLFRAIGGPLDMAAILASGLLTFFLRGEPGFGWTLAGALLLALAFIAWLTIVAPANAVLATWHAGPVPANFISVRDRWETGHMIVAGLKIFGFLTLAVGATSGVRSA